MRARVSGDPVSLRLAVLSPRGIVRVLNAGIVERETQDLDVALPPSEVERMQDLCFDLRFILRGRERQLRFVRQLRLSSPIAVDSTIQNGTFRFRIVNESTHDTVESPV